MKKLIKSFSISFLVLCALMLTFSTGAQAANKLKIGSKKIKILAEDVAVTDIAGTNMNIFLLSDRGKNTGVMNLYFSEILDQIKEGAEFDLAPKYRDNISGKVTMTASIISPRKRNGQKKSLGASEGSIIRGKVRIIKVNDDGSFTLRLKAKVKKPAMLISDERKGTFKLAKGPKKALKILAELDIDPIDI